MTIAEFFATQFIREESLRRSGIVGNSEWTHHLSAVVASVASSNGFHVKTKAVPDEFRRAEYFTLDAILLEGAYAQHGAKGLTFPLPAICVEFENTPDKILYDYWKLLCVRARLRVLAFIVPTEELESRHVAELSGLRAEHNEIEGEDLLLGGRNGMAGAPGIAWTVYVWRSGAFQRVRAAPGEPWMRHAP